MCLIQYWVAVKKAMSEGSAQLPWDLVKLIGLGVVVFLLGSTMTGNWIRCNFFDANGCLPRLVAEVNTTAIALETVRKLEANYYKVDDYPTNEQKFEYIRYDLVINNKGRDHVDTMSIEVIPALGPTNPGRVLLYGIDTGLQREAELQSGNEYEFGTLNFEDVDSLAVTELIKVLFVIAYDRKLYTQKQGTAVVFLVRCESCQESLTKLEAGGGS